MTKKMPLQKSKREFIRVGGFLREIITVYDKTGKVIHKAITPLMLEFRPRDAMQIIVGATILAIPIGFTEEVWNLGETLPLGNVLGLGAISILFLSLFVYYNYYRRNFRGHEIEFTKRVVATYIMTLLIVGLLLFLIGKAPWNVNFILSLKRTLIVSLPASMSAAVTDMLK